MYDSVIKNINEKNFFELTINFNMLKVKLLIFNRVTTYLTNNCKGMIAFVVIFAIYMCFKSIPCHLHHCVLNLHDTKMSPLKQLNY